MTEAIVLAGGPPKALTPIGSMLMIEYVVKALLKSVKIERVIIAGPQAELSEIFESESRITVVPGGETTIKSLLNALQLITTEGKKVLVATADIPLLTPEAVDDFLAACLNREGDLFYPIVRRSSNEEKYPGVRRTYVKLKDGVFTGGNIILVDPRAIVKCVKVGERLIELRKSPLALAHYVGWGLLFRYMLGILTLEEAEERVSQLLGLTGKSIISLYPEIGIDVDKESDLQLVRENLVGY